MIVFEPYFLLIFIEFSLKLSNKSYLTRSYSPPQQIIIYACLVNSKKIINYF